MFHNSSCEGVRTVPGVRGHASMMRVGEMLLEFGGAMRRRVRRQHASSCTICDRLAINITQIAKILECLVRRSRDENLSTWLEELAEPRPFVGDDGCSARRGLKQPDAWRVAGIDHRRARDVQCETLRTIKGW